MNRLKIFSVITLAVSFFLCLVACGKTNDNIAGDDWRTSGVVVGSGTIKRGGDSADVLVTVGENGAAFYWDKSEQILFDSISFPIEVQDAYESFDSISFDDINGDGESDVSIDFVRASDDEVRLVWTWTGSEHYVFREDLSSIPSGVN